ncbi:hypothetical protein [Castellaniella sp.]|uniref:hypothetical protein n=1 Tax=Castellaniella sp. TaxID=1955812 RepID=UPI002AFFE299|nr:hypothetical protein [Castellaniella sp.]
MEAISGTRRAMKEMADGTIRVQVDIDPSCRAAFLQLFPNIDMPVALAPLRADFERSGAVPPSGEKPKGGELARLAGQLCQNPAFQAFVPECADGLSVEENAAAWIRKVCEVSSRAELDHSVAAAFRFHERVRKPFLAREAAV